MQENYLEQLKDIHMPQSPGFWPPSLNLVVGLLILLLFLGLSIFFYAKFRKKRTIKKLALVELKAIENNFVRTNDKAQLQNSINILLKRLAMTKENSSMSKIFPKNIFVRAEEILQKDRFKKDPSINVDEIIKLAKELIKKCRL